MLDVGASCVDCYGEDDRYAEEEGEEWDAVGPGEGGEAVEGEEGVMG